MLCVMICEKYRRVDDTGVTAYSETINEKIKKGRGRSRRKKKKSNEKQLVRHCKARAKLSVPFVRTHIN